MITTKVINKHYKKSTDANCNFGYYSPNRDTVVTASLHHYRDHIKYLASDGMKTRIDIAVLLAGAAPQSQDQTAQDICDDIEEGLRNEAVRMD